MNAVCNRSAMSVPAAVRQLYFELTLLNEIRGAAGAVLILRNNRCEGCTSIKVNERCSIALTLAIVSGWSVSGKRL